MITCLLPETDIPVASCAPSSECVSPSWSSSCETPTMISKSTRRVEKHQEGDDYDRPSPFLGITYTNITLGAALFMTTCATVIASTLDLSLALWYIVLGQANSVVWQVVLTLLIIRVEDDTDYTRIKCSDDSDWLEHEKMRGKLSYTARGYLEDDDSDCPSPFPGIPCKDIAFGAALFTNNCVSIITLFVVVIPTSDPYLALCFLVDIVCQIIVNCLIMGKLSYTTRGYLVGLVGVATLVCVWSGSMGSYVRGTLP
jgi:hypothetical protein